MILKVCEGSGITLGICSRPTSSLGSKAMASARVANPLFDLASYARRGRVIALDCRRVRFHRLVAQSAERRKSW